MAHHRGDLYSVIWIPILDHDYRYRPTKTVSPVGRGREHAPGLSVFTACLLSGLSVRGLRLVVVLLGLAVQRNIPYPTSCQDGHYVLSVSVPSC